MISQTHDNQTLEYYVEMDHDIIITKIVEKFCSHFSQGFCNELYGSTLKNVLETFQLHKY